MKKNGYAEKILLEDISRAALCAQKASKNLSIGKCLRLIRIQLGMSQSILAKRAGVPQSTISYIENDDVSANLMTLNKILNGLSCDLLLLPVMRESVEAIRQRQAKKQAEKHVKYLQGTMNLENQSPDPRFLGELQDQEEKRLLYGPGSKLWED